MLEAFVVLFHVFRNVQVFKLRLLHISPLLDKPHALRRGTDTTASTTAPTQDPTHASTSLYYYYYNAYRVAH